MHRISFLSACLALAVIMLGAFVRLSDAGLGCPDWPGCYGQLMVPELQHEVAAANGSYPERPVESGKAWKEMVHRYFAGTLGLLIMSITIIAWKQHISHKQRGIALPTLLLALVAFQAMLGMWTVTLLLKPLVVTAHLLGGMTILSLLWWLFLRHGGYLLADEQDGSRRALRLWTVLGIALLFLQISLGGWTSANYAALACPELPTCQLEWWPHMDFSEAFVLWRGLGIDYEYGVLESAARTAIHLTHRMGALVVFVYLATFSIYAFVSKRGVLRRLAAVVALLLMLQVSLGLSNVYFGLPLPVAVMHNGGAGLLLLALVTLLHSLVPLKSPQDRRDADLSPAMVHVHGD